MEALEVASEANSTAIAANSKAVKATNTAVDALSKATSANSAAIAATNKAVDATNTAVAANSTAIEASNKAVKALTASSQANSKAIEAVSESSAANSTAIKAMGKAVDATNTATAANTNAIAATNKAVSATNKSVEALTKASEANSTAIAATNKAVTAANDASAANTKAIRSTNRATYALTEAIGLVHLKNHGAWSVSQPVLPKTGDVIVDFNVQKAAVSGCVGVPIESGGSRVGGGVRFQEAGMWSVDLRLFLVSGNDCQISIKHMRSGSVIDQAASLYLGKGMGRSANLHATFLAESGDYVYVTVTNTGHLYSSNIATQFLLGRFGDAYSELSVRQLSRVGQPQIPTDYLQI